MTISVSALAALVTVALAVTTGAPVLLIALLIRDWKRKRLW